MRITGGVFGGRNLKVPKSDLIRPTQDRVREAVFNILQFELPGKRFLDLFAGSGVVGLEALSRGASSVTFVERERRHLKVLAENLALLGAEAAGRTETVAGDAYGFLSRYAGLGFDIAFADPPYALGEEKGYASVLATLAERGVVAPGGLFIAEMTAVQRAEETPGWELVRDRTYGKTRICMWRREVEDEVEGEGRDVSRLPPSHLSTRRRCDNQGKMK